MIAPLVVRRHQILLTSCRESIRKGLMHLASRLSPADPNPQVDGAVAAIVDAGIAAFGRIDVLHNNVGIVEVGGPVETTEESWDRVNDVNLKSMFLTCKRVLPQMERRGKGAIVNIASVSGNCAAITYPAVSESEVGGSRHAPLL